MYSYHSPWHNLTVETAYVFGTNPRICDVLLGHRGSPGVGERHFCIFLDTYGSVILRDSSTCDGQAGDETQHQRTWILSLRGRKRDIIVYVPQSTGLAFKVELATHETCQSEFLENLNTFLGEGEAGLPPLDMLGIFTHITTEAPS